MTSFANVNPSLMELTACRVTFDGVDVGGTLGGVKVVPKTKKAAIKADALGDTLLDQRVSGFGVTVELELAEVLSMDTWKRVFPHFKKVGAGPSAIYADSQIGASDLANAKVLTLHPLSKADGDFSSDFTFFKATSMADSDLTYSPTGQQKLKVVFTIYPDTGVQPARFLQYGDPSIGLVAALAGAPGFAGTGNGTLTGATPSNGPTKTENIVVTCVGQTGGNKFEVHGSVSGPMGIATLGAAAASTVHFVAPNGQIGFTLTQGSVEFIVGDSFTIATTAANFA